MSPQSVGRPYYGQIRTSHTYSGLTLIEATYTPQVKLPRHWHPRSSFCLILKGGYIESYGKLRLECRPSHLKFQPGGESHSDDYGIQEGRSFIIELNQEWLERMRSCSLPVTCPNLHQNPLTVSLLNRMRHELHQTDDITPFAVEGLMLEVIAELARSDRRSVLTSSHWLEQAREILHDRFSERLSLSEIARLVGVHPVYLANSFRQRHHCSIGEYVRWLRIDFARRRISQTDDSLIDIAFAAGFSNQSHFTRIFKRLTGQTPAQYRTMLRS
ncbi:AraC family transcriptional regulator [bacterium]|nr:AraC family transcriptional regulator [bacterium]MCI0603467.1 AraC family transcriptional regulator [bacterium]